MSRSYAILVSIFLSSTAISITSPERFFGHEVGADYYLSNYSQFSAYWTLLDKESPKMKVFSIGKTEEGRDQLAAIISSEKNISQLAALQNHVRNLALGKNISLEQAKQLSKTAKPIVWIDGGLHATEVLGAQQLIETSFRLISSEDEETNRILNDVIILMVHANPDGMELCSNWYMQEPDKSKRNLNIPRLYQKYIGHDNNRDFLAVTQSETRNMCKLMYREWFPQIVYNHHQTGPSGTVMFAPPFRDPFNHQIDPLVMSGVDFVGAAMMQRFLSKDMFGVTTKSGAPYSAWWNGGLRTAAYFHNMIGILTETIGNPTPMRIPFVANRQISQGNLLAPIQPQEWKFKQSVEYSVQANYAILDFASRYRETLLLNAFTIARRQIELAKRDSWTNKPKTVSAAKSMEEVKKPELRNPRYYVIPSSQLEFEVAKQFVNSMYFSGIEVYQAKTGFKVGQKSYPTGSFIISCQQAFRPFILDQFEPQDHPNDIPSPGATPTPPYDSAGYTLALQMGFEFDRILENSDTLNRLSDNFAIVSLPYQLQKSVAINSKLSTKSTADYALIFDALKKGFPVVKTNSDEYLIGRSDNKDAQNVRNPRIGLLDVYGGSMDSGWIRWIFDQFGILYTVVFPKDLEKGDLSNRFDTVIFPAGVVGESLREPVSLENDRIPIAYRNMTGSVSSRTIPFLLEFVKSGGTIIGIGSSAWIGKHLGLPIENALTENGRPIPRSSYFAPGSLMSCRIVTGSQVTSGLNEKLVVFFDNNPAFKISDPGKVKEIAKFENKNPLISGWLWGPEYLQNKTIMCEGKLGKGTIYMFSPEITFRAQPWGSFKLLFNAVLQSRMEEKGGN